MASSTAVLDVLVNNKEVPLFRFANGKLKENLHVSDLKIRCFHSDSTEVGTKRKKAKKILVAESRRVHYTGYNFGPNAPKTGGFCRFHVGIHDKDEGTLKVVPASLFIMKPNFNSDENLTDETNISNREKRDNLTVAFGSKKKRRAVDSRGTQQVHEDSLQASATTVIQETPTENTKHTKTSAEQSQSEALPPRNNQASLPESVYEIDSLISKEEQNALLPAVDELCEADKDTVLKWKTECRFCSYVIFWLQRLPTNSSGKIMKCILLLYYQQLVNLLNLRYSDFRRKDPLPSVVEPLKSLLLQKFTLKSAGPNGKISRSMPERLKDKAVAYAVVTALHIENFTLDLSSLQSDIKVPQNKMTTICYALGCYVSSRKNLDGLQTKVIELKLPLYVMKDKGVRRTKN